MTSPLLYGRVEDWIGGLVVDGLDADDLPDDVDLTGTATFEPVLTDEKGGIRVPGMVPRPKWLNVQPVTATYANGRLTHRGLPYVMLLSPASEINPMNWKWKVSFALKLNGSSITRTSFAFVLPPYDPDAVPANPGGLNPTVVNLVTVQPIAVPGPGTGVVQGPRGFGVVDVETVDDGGVASLQFKVASESGPVPIGDPIELPGGGGSVSDESLAELAGDPATATGAAIGERVLEVGDIRYSRTQLVVDPTDADYGVTAAPSEPVKLSRAGQELAGAVRLSQFSFSGTAWVDVEGVELRLGTGDAPAYVEFNAGLCVVNGTTAANIYIRILDSVSQAIVPGAFATAYVPANAQGFSSVQLPVIRGRLPAGRPEHRLVAQIQNTDGQLSYIIPDWLPGKQGVLTAFGA